MKTYIKPETEMLKAQVENMLAAESLGNNGTVDDPTIIRAPENFKIEDDEEN